MNKATTEPSEMLFISVRRDSSLPGLKEEELLQERQLHGCPGFCAVMSRPRRPHENPEDDTGNQRTGSFAPVSIFNL